MSTSSRFQSRLAPKAGVARLVTVNNNVLINNNAAVKHKEPSSVPDAPGAVDTRPPCICNRPQQLVMCQGCGYTLDGRVRLQCPAHPAISFLLDLTACPQCKGDVARLKEFPKCADANTSRRTRRRTEQMMDTDG